MKKQSTEQETVHLLTAADNPDVANWQVAHEGYTKVWKDSIPFLHN
jgi:hypothetical protein